MAAAVKGEGTVVEQQPKDASSSESKTEVTAGDTSYTSAKTFEELNLSCELCRGLDSEIGLETPCQIQAISLPMLPTPPYQNLIAQATTGYGKTTCFVLGMLSRVDPEIHAPQALCVCPTEEITMKNLEVLMKIGRHLTDITFVCTVQTDPKSYLSPSKRKQITDQVVIGTPPTVKKWINTCLNTKHIKILVFDEFDHMLAQGGFRDDSFRIIIAIQKKLNDRQDDSQGLSMRNRRALPNEPTHRQDGLPDAFRRIEKGIQKEKDNHQDGFQGVSLLNGKVLSNKQDHRQERLQDDYRTIEKGLQKEEDDLQDGFQDDFLRIIKDIQKNRDDCQILLFSATYDENVKQFISTLISKAKQVFVEKEELSLDVIKQYVVKCPDELAKVEILKGKIFLLAEKLGQSIIFVRTRENASMLHSKLEAEGYKCTSIYRGLKPDDRDRVIKEFRTGVTKILISNDVLARGFYEAQVTLVVNFDLPIVDPDCKVYWSRISRIGRFGHKGVAFNFICTDQDEKTMSKIEKYIQQQVPEVPWNSEDAFEAVLKDAGLA